MGRGDLMALPEEEAAPIVHFSLFPGPVIQNADRGAGNRNRVSGAWLGYATLSPLLALTLDLIL